MSDFARYCPKCYQFFSDLDLFTKHVEVCGFAKKTADGRQQTAGKSSQESGVRIQKESGKRIQKAGAAAEQNGGGNEFSDSSIPTPDSCILTPDSLQKSPKFKT